MMEENKKIIDDDYKIIVIKPNMIKKWKPVMKLVQKIICEKIWCNIEKVLEKQLDLKEANFLYKHLENREDVSKEKLIEIKNFIQETPLLFLKINTNKSFDEIRNIIWSRKLEQWSLREIFHEEWDQSCANSIHFPDTKEQMINELKFFKILKKIESKSNRLNKI